MKHLEVVRVGRQVALLEEVKEGGIDAGRVHVGKELGKVRLVLLVPEKPVGTNKKR
jgi:hypothetical protein